MTGMLESAGAVNMFKDIDHESRPVEEKSVLERDPDYIMLCWCGALQGQMAIDKVKKRPGWGNLKAVREGRIYLMDEGLYGRPGPRIVQGLELLHSILAGKTPPGDTQKAELGPIAIGGN
jgi:iron complex transport system substrate-binding protein